MVTIMLATPLVTRCAGGVANPASSSPTTSTTLKTPKVSPQSLATTPVHSAARSITLTLDIGIVIASFITAGGAIAAGLLTAGALITAPLLNGAIPAAFISGGSIITAYIIAGLIQLVPTILYHAQSTQVIQKFP